MYAGARAAVRGRRCEGGGARAAVVTEVATSQGAIDAAVDPEWRW